LDNDVRAQQFWNAYATAAQVNGTEFTICGFGDSAELADALASLVIAGTKRATASLARDYTGPGQPLPKSGDFSIVIDGHRRPRCIIRIVNVDIKAMRDVDARFAWDEGEGDRSLAWWMSAHTRYFARQGAREGFAVDGDTEVVLERFEVVWPPELADRMSKGPGEEPIHSSQPNVFP
jgi:uncharacterized protein YhfF